MHLAGLSFWLKSGFDEDAEMLADPHNDAPHLALSFFLREVAKDHIAEQTFYQGLTTHKNRYDFATLGQVDKMYSDQLQKPTGVDFWKWIETAQIKL